MDMLLPLKFSETVPVQDRIQRSLQELRVSVIDRYSEERGLPGHDQEKVEMYRLGG